MLTDFGAIKQLIQEHKIKIDKNDLPKFTSDIEKLEIEFQDIKRCDSLFACNRPTVCHITANGELYK